jgi:hypothetical protein
LSLRRDFYQVEAFAPSYFERLLRCHYSELGALFIDYANLADPNSFVYPD